MLPTLESLHCFSEAARLLNFRAASRAVALTPAALGQRIRQLEHELGTTLFHRTTRKVVLTQAGLALIPYARRALEAAEDCARAGAGQLGPTPLDLTLGTRHELGMSWLLPLLPELRACREGLTVHLYFGSSADLLLRVRNLEIDCAVGSMTLGDPRIDSIRLHREDYLFVASPRLLKKKPLRHEHDAETHTLIDTTASMSLFGYFRSAAGGGDRLRWKSVLVMGTIAAIRALVLDGEGVAVLPAYLVAPDVRAGRLVSVFPSVKLRSDWFRLIFRADDPRRSLYTTLAERLLATPLR
jgi:DNA-binding transcriptional LysR family regulator